jgi:hypothetical protein
LQVVLDYTTALRVKLPTACILVKAVEKAGIQTALLKAKVQTVRKKNRLELGNMRKALKRVDQSGSKCPKET